VLATSNVSLSLEGWFAFIAIVIVSVTVFLVARHGRTYHVHWHNGDDDGEELAPEREEAPQPEG
jgi:hypothetical protein